MRTDSEILAIDCVPNHHVKVAAYLIRHGESAAFVDNHTTRALPHLMDGLRSVNLACEQVKYIIVTHVHLDHASGTRALLEACPNATVLAHPRAVRHLVRPERLVASARAVYGEKHFLEMYGDMPPVPAERVRIVEDGEWMELGGAPLEFLHTEGHARHHICIHDPAQKAIFTGDTFGAGCQLPRGGCFLFCSCPPTDFDPAAARDTYRRIEATGAQTAWITHFGAIDITPSAMEQLNVSTRAMEEIGRAAYAAGLTGPDLADFCLAGVKAAFDNHLAGLGLEGMSDDMPWSGGDLRMDASGIAYWVERVLRRRREVQEGGDR